MILIGWALTRGVFTQQQKHKHACPAVPENSQVCRFHHLAEVNVSAYLIFFLTLGFRL